MIGLGTRRRKQNRKTDQRLEFYARNGEKRKIGNPVLSDIHDRTPCRHGSCVWFAVGTHDRVSNSHDRATCAGTRKLDFSHF